MSHDDERHLSKSKRSRMHPGLAAHFPKDNVHDRVARALCEQGGLPRREFFESWSFVQRARRFLDAPVVWDLCAGHGLVALLFALLEPQLERVVAVDKRKPASWERVRAAIASVDAARAAKVEFLPRKLDGLVLEERAFVVAVHACGRRTDEAIALAIASSSSVAVLPCCHEVKALEIPDAVRMRWPKPEAVDLARIFKLHAAGYRTVSRRIDDGVSHCADAIIGVRPSS